MGRLADGFRYCWSQVVSIAAFLEGRSRRFNPPSWRGLQRRLRAIGEDFRWFQTKSRVSFVRAERTVFGMPWAFVRNCVILPTVSCIISRFASREGLVWFQRSSACLIFSIVGVQGWAGSRSFPIQAPRQRVGCPSGAILMFSGRGWSSGWSCLVVRTHSRCCLVPVGITSVFSTLNFAPEARHHRVRIYSSVSYLSDSDR